MARQITGTLAILAAAPLLTALFAHGVWAHALREYAEVERQVKNLDVKLF